MHSARSNDDGKNDHTNKRPRFSDVMATTVIILSLFFISCLSVLRLNAQSEQATPAHRQLAEFLKAYNTGDKRVLKKFFIEHFDKAALEKRSADERASTAIATFNITRQLNLHSVEERGDHEIVAVCQSQITEAWFSITMDFSGDPPRGITGQAFGFATRPADAVPHGRLGRSQIVKNLDLYLTKLAAANMISGAILVAKNDKTIFEKAYGFDAAQGPHNLNSRFDLASLVKMFTSVAIAQLAQQKKISYGDSIGKFLPNYPNKEAAEKITIHHLLTHTSGLSEYSDKKEYRPARNSGSGFETLTDWLPFFASDPLIFKPGEKSEYSNSNFILLGVILEKVTGENYFDYIREYIFKPADMENSSLTVANGNSAGGGLSTVGDLMKFVIALCSHKLLSKKYTDLIVTPKVDTGGGESYGYGFEITQTGGQRIIGHSGGGNADNRLDIYLDRHYTTVILAAPFAGQNITRKLREMITQR